MDPLQKIRRDISIFIVDIDTLLEEREKIPIESTGADYVQKKYRNQNAIENKLSQLKNEIDKFSQEITSMKKNKSKNKLNYNIQQLEDHLSNYGEQYDERRVLSFIIYYLHFYFRYGYLFFYFFICSFR